MAQEADGVWWLIFMCADCVVSKADMDIQLGIDNDMVASWGLQGYVATGEGIPWPKAASLAPVVPCFTLEDRCSLV